MSNRYPLLRATTGLNNKDDPTRLSYNPESGVAELAEAVNVNIDKTGKPSRRKGYIEVSDLTDVHSMFPHNEYLYLIANGVLYAMNHSQGLTSLGAIGNARTSYQPVGEKLYFTNLLSNGYLIDRNRFPWDASEYIGPPTDRTYSNPPMGSHLCLFQGRMLIAKDNFVYGSERFAYHWFDMARCYLPVGADIRMLARVETGFYVGVDGRILYYEGNEFESVSMTEISKETIVTGTEQMVQGSWFPDYRIFKPMIIAATDKGVVLLGPGGFYKNLTEDKVVYESSKFGGSVIIDKRYIFSLEP